ncbi:MAG: GTPase HflX [Clostridiales Family XIII bacterium]|jgi:GTP-binding protein HflX|nr:GTPase HflX [Clostridiales Family XIII bacterium]
MIKFTEENETIENETCRAILVGIQLDGDIGRSMDELAALAEAAGACVIGELTQARDAPDRATYLGKGKAEEVGELCRDMDADAVICNDELSGAQIRNLEDATGVRVIDRTALILDIFARRASSKEGRLQVELAQLQYRLPRLTGLGKSLSRLGGGIGTRGPGEKKLETDRRHIARRMDEIKKELREFGAQREVRRSRRKRNDVPVAALVGYTNSGKSAIMNSVLAMTGNEDKQVLEKDMLFATLDTFQRRIKLQDNSEFVLEDTVGFVSKLPHGLVKAFKATLEEVVEADLLIHVIDASYDDQGFHIKVVEDVLAELGASGKDVIKVFNKIDLLDASSGAHVGEPSLLIGGAAGGNGGAIALSAKRGDNMGLLLEQVRERLFADMREAELLIPFSRGDIVAYLKDAAHVDELEYVEEGTRVRARLAKADYDRLAAFAHGRPDAPGEK